MKKESNTHGSGLAIFSLIILAVSFVSIIYFKNFFLASIVAFLAAILAAASYIESRRANGARRFTLITLIITIAGTLFTLIWTGTTRTSQPDEIIREENIPLEKGVDKSKTFDELENVAEELEKDSLEEKRERR